MRRGSEVDVACEIKREGEFVHEDDRGDQRDLRNGRQRYSLVNTRVAKIKMKGTLNFLSWWHDVHATPNLSCPSQKE